MFTTRRTLLLGLIVIGSQIATGCCYQRPLLPGLRYCGPGAPLLNRPLLAPAGAAPVYSGPVISGPVYDTGVPISSAPGFGSTCTNCGTGGYGGIPIAAAPGGVPIAATQPGYSYPITPGAAAPASYVNPNVSVPLNMPTAMPGGVPFDSSLAPTVKPPFTNPVDSKKLATIGK